MIVRAMLAAVVLFLLVGCDEKDTLRTLLPSESQAATLRTIEPPAAVEVRDLRAQELAAELAALRAKADGDLAEAQRQGVIAAELARLRGAAEAREQSQRADLDRRIAAADAATQREREAQAAAAEVQRKRDEQATWRTTCRWIALGCLVGGAVVAGSGLWANAFATAAWPAAGLAGIGLVVQAWGESLGVLAWLLPVAGALAVAVVVVVVIRRRTAVAVENAHLGDAIETGKDALGRGIAEVKQAAKRAQERAGIFKRIERIRGKA